MTLDYSKLQNGSDIRGVALVEDDGKAVNLTRVETLRLTMGFAKWLSEKCGKDYKELKLIIACHGNTIDLVTIMPNFQTATNRQKKKYQSDKRKSLDKKYNKAMAKRKW